MGGNVVGDWMDFGVRWSRYVLWVAGTLGTTVVGERGVDGDALKLQMLVVVYWLWSGLVFLLRC